MSQVQAKIRCRIGWKLLQEYDNSGNKNTTIKRTLKVVESKEITGKDFSKSVNESTKEAASKINVEASASVTWGPVSASVSSGYESSKMLKDFVSSTTEVTRETNSKWEKTEEQSYDVGPGDRLYFYQQTFTGPGIYFTLDTTSVTSQKKGPQDDQDVDIIVDSKPVRFIDYLDVKYGDRESDAPEDRVRTFGGASDDINNGHKGKYVWLKPVWTTDTSKGSTGFEIRIQSSAVDGWKDLAKEAGGAYRYVYANHDQNQNTKIVDVRLIRSRSGLTAQQQKEMLSPLGPGWVGGQRDINQDRGGDWLYLAYKLY